MTSDNITGSTNTKNEANNEYNNNNRTVGNSSGSSIDDDVTVNSGRHQVQVKLEEQQQDQQQYTNEKTTTDTLSYEDETNNTNNNDYNKIVKKEDDDDDNVDDELPTCFSSSNDNNDDAGVDDLVNRGRHQVQAKLEKDQQPQQHQKFANETTSAITTTTDKVSNQDETNNNTNNNYYNKIIKKENDVDDDDVPPIMNSGSNGSDFARNNNMETNTNAKTVSVSASASAINNNNQDESSSSVSLSTSESVDTTQSTNNYNNTNLLYLFMGLNDTIRLENSLQFVTIQDLVNIRCVSKDLYTKLEFIEYTHCRDGNDYMIPYPGYPGLLMNITNNNNTDIQRLDNRIYNNNNNTNNNCNGLFAHQLASLRSMYHAENSSCAKNEFGSLRGGILCDAPGLGKTITILGLIVSTVGQRVVTPTEFWNTIQINNGWNLLRTNVAMNHTIQKSIYEIRVYVTNNWKRNTLLYKEYKRILNYIEPPYNDNRLQTINEFEYYIRTNMKAIGIPYQLLDIFYNNIINLKISLDKNNRKLLHSINNYNNTNNNNSNNNNEKINNLYRLLYERQLVSTSATLIIVPDPLLEHWTQQISNHLNLLYISNTTTNTDNPIENTVYIDGLGDISKWINNNNNNVNNNNKNNDDTNNYNNNSHSNTATISLQTAVNTSSEKLKANMPPVWDLIQYTIVVTTFSRCKQLYDTECKYHNNFKNTNNNDNNNLDESSTNSDQQQQQQQQSSRKRQKRSTFDSTNNNNNNNKSTISSFVSPLLKIRWLRLIIDEGHELGGSSSSTKTKTNNGTNGTSANDTNEEQQYKLIQFINQIAAERRWVISGTPTTGNEDHPNYKSNALDQIQRLLYFLRHPKYGRIVTLPGPSTVTPSTSTLSSSSNANASTRASDESSQQETEASRTTATEASTKTKEPNRVLSVRSAWEKNVKIPFLNYEESGRKELIKVLQETMIMHQKEDINLPRPKFVNGEYNVPIPKEIDTNFVSMYYTAKEQQQQKLNSDVRIEEKRRRVVRVIKKKSLADKFTDYLHSTEYQSVVDKAQAEYVINAVRKERTNLNNRRSNAKKLQLSPSSSSRSSRNNDIESTSSTRTTTIDLRPIKVVVYTHETNNLLSVGELILREIDNEHVCEMYSYQSIAEQSFELNRFRTGEKEFRTCPICHCENNCFTQQQQQQQSQSNSFGNKGNNGRIVCQRMLMEVVLVSNCTERFLIEPERIRNTINVPIERMGDEKLTSYNKHSKFWEVNDILEIDIRDPHPLFTKRCTDTDVYYNWNIDTCIELAKKDQFQGKDWFYGPLPIVQVNNDNDDTVQEQFVHVILKKWQHCGQYHNRNRWYTGPTLLEQPIQRIQQDVHILLLDAKLAHGLDLSFVTHIYLLDPIEDAALLEQITSRAYRIGATGPVTVETVNIYFETSNELDDALKDDEKIFEETYTLSRRFSDDDDDRDDITYIRNGSKSTLLSTKQQKHKKKQSNRTNTSTNTNDIKTVSKQVCDYCFRTFLTLEDAEAHELISCPRNPKNVSSIDPFSLTSIYRTIKPPPAIRSSYTTSTSTSTSTNE